MIERYATRIYEIKDAYKKILIDVKSANIKIEASSDEKTELVFVEDKKRRFVFGVQNDTLKIRSQRTRWYNLLRIGYKHPRISLSVPKSILDNLSVKTSVGCVDVSSIVCTGDINIRTNTGRVNVSDISSKAFTSRTNTGNVTLTKLTATDVVSIECNTGKAELNDCNARKFSIKTRTGSVCGKLPSNTVFMVKTNTGKIEIPTKTAIGEAIGAICEIETNTGCVRFE